MQDIKFISLLGDDLYTTFLGTYQGKKCVIKFFTRTSDENNETQVMEYMKNHSIMPELYPCPYFSIWIHGDISITSSDGKHSMLDVYRVICYEYIENDNRDDDINVIISDIKKQLTDLHSHGFIHGDVRKENIIFGKQMGKYQLIDYGRTFSVINAEKYPPMQYMVENSEIPTFEEDLECLNKIVINSKH